VSAAEHSEAVQNYLRVIYKLEKQDGRATTSAIAETLDVTAASATGMVTKLASRGLVEHTPYRGVTLTVVGERDALEVVRHHRLLERYLSESLSVPLADVHDEADRLEHALSERLEAQIDASLGHPTHDPHGDPIPDLDLNVAAEELRALSDVGEGQRATIRRVPDSDEQILEELCALGLLPGVSVLVKVASPEQSLTLIVDGTERALPMEVAAQIGVA
jgi:DtxR family Mn-dependent transcriptional regulator